MKIFRTVEGIRRYLKGRKGRGETIGFVPTMGCLHKGHLSLIREARRKNDLVAISIFVNPTQFGPKEDYKRYPRNFKHDRRLAEAAGVDVIFYPASREIYPGPYRSFVDVVDITERLCGRSRPGHFKGVATIVIKLLNIIRPDILYLGQKDAQQAIVIKQMIRDLNMDLKVRVMPIIRAPDGLAMSSRNIYLSERERRDALVLFESLSLARGLIREGVRDARRIKELMRKLIRSKNSTCIDYISIADTGNLQESKTVRKKVLIALAVWVGKTRLIDNIIVGGKI